MKLKKKYQLGGNSQIPYPELMWGQLPNIQGQAPGVPQMPISQPQSTLQMQTKPQFGNVNYDWRAASNSIQAIAAGFRGFHQNKEQNDYYRAQFNPLNIIEKTGNTSQQNQFGMDYAKQGGEVDDIFGLPKMQTGGPVNTTGYLDGSATAQNDYNIIPGDDITMKGVSKKIQATPIYNGIPGQSTVMHPGLDYSFKGADVVHEQPFNTEWNGGVPTFNYNKQLSKVNLNLNATPGGQFGVGLTKSFQAGGRTPITTTNPNDPRLKAYNDSLSLYNIYASQLEYAKKYPNFTFSDISNLEKPLSKSEATLQAGWNTNTIRSIGSTIIGNGLNERAIWKYKKPVQPVVYQKLNSNYSKGEQQLIGNKQQSTVSWQDKDGKVWQDFNPNGYNYKQRPIEYQKPQPTYNLKEVTQERKDYPLANPENYKAHGSVEINSPEQNQMPTPQGQIMYGPANSAIGYMTSAGQFTPIEQDKMGQLNKADRELLANPEALKKYTTTTPRYQDGGPIDFEKDFEDELFNEPVQEQTQVKPEEVNQEQSFTPEEISQPWLSYLLGTEDNKDENIMSGVGSALSGASNGKFQSFATPEQGRAALEHQLELYQTGKSKSGIKPTDSLFEFTSKYAPSGDGKNDPLAYATFLSKKLGVSINTPISRLDKSKLADVITQMENNKSGNNNFGNLRKIK